MSPNSGVRRRAPRAPFRSGEIEGYGPFRPKQHDCPFRAVLGPCADDAARRIAGAGEIQPSRLAERLPRVDFGAFAVKLP